ncbi:MAG: hypothetical protein FJW30_03290 [Acidobacteria bacterium]|nr:hypothetical protein [Acidobacteriota bacterium]
MTAAEREAIVALVGRIEASDGFAQSERLCRFLRFTVTEWLAGNAGQIKEYAIGREVFDRNDNYDPRLDPIVRVEARRLRKKLEEYYAGPGSSEPIRLSYPKGSYAPSLETGRSRPVPWRPIAAAILALGLAGVYFGRPTAAEKVAVVPARWVWPAEDATGEVLDADLAERIAAEMALRGTATVDWPTLQSFASGSVSVQTIGEKTGASRVLVIAVRREPEGLRATAYMVDPAAGRKINVVDRSRLDLASPESRAAEAARIVRDLSGPGAR